MDINALVNQAKENTEKLENQTETTSGGDFEYEVPAAGKTPARFVGYVEVGKRPQRPYQGKDKPPAEEVRLYFELNGKKHQREVEVDGEKRIFTNTISVKLTKKLSDKAGFTKLFKQMLYGRDGITHMAQMLGEGFLINVVHNTVKKEGQKDRTYANMKDDNGNWLIEAPMVYDPISETSQPIPVPEVTQPVKLLLWDAPSKEQWDSIFIDGTRTVKGDDGQEREVSKNWLQEDIVQNALNFHGSALEAMVGGLGDLDLTPDAPGDAAGAATESENPGEGMDTPEEGQKPSADASDVLASIGL